MTKVHQRAARREGQLADALGTERVKHRPRFQKAPDVLPVRLPGGFVLQGESKSRKKLPAWLVAAVEQAAGYTPGALPLVSLYALGSTEALAVLRLRDLCLLLGLAPPPAGEQLSLAARVA
jgi:hypothetical protein